MLLMSVPSARDPGNMDGAEMEDSEGSVTIERGTPDAKPLDLPENCSRAPGDPRMCLADFEIGRPLSSGKFGNVYLARTKKEQFPVALKIMLKSDISRYRQEVQVKWEVEIQCRLKHVNCLQLYTWFHDKDRVYLALEYAAKGDLWEHMKEGIIERQAAKYVWQVVQGLMYLHNNKILHRDIKPENLLVTHADQIKISDFGWSIQAKEPCATLCGTLDYLAPEMLDGSRYLESVDVWSIGVLTYELLYGKPPFGADGEEATKRRIAAVDLQFPSQPRISYEAFQLVSGLLKRNPTKRLTLKEVTEHVWFQKQLGNRH